MSVMLSEWMIRYENIACLQTVIVHLGVSLFSIEAQESESRTVWFYKALVEQSTEQRQKVNNFLADWTADTFLC